MPSTPSKPKHGPAWPTLLLFLGPTVLGVLVFNYLPLLASAWLSTQQWDLLSPPRFVGAAHYARLLAPHSLFWPLALQTLLYAVAYALLAMACSVGVAWLVFTHKGRLSHSVQAMVFVPYLTPMVAVAVVADLLWHPSQGLVNQLATGLHWLPHSVAWLQHPKTALPLVLLLELWKYTGYSVLLVLGALHRLNPQVWEAAQLEGASLWRQLVQVALPQLQGTLALVLTLALLHALQSFDAIYLLTQGGPQHKSTLLLYWAYQLGLEQFNLGQSAAVAWLLVVGVVALQGLSNRTLSNQTAP